MFTEDERSILSTTIALHGFEVFNRWLPSQGIWRPLLVRQHGGVSCSVIREVTSIDGGVYADHPVRDNFNPDWIKLTWVELTDTQLSEFHRVVLLTC